MHPRYGLIVAANRDEFHDRPTRAAHWWTDASGVLGGRDLRAGGAWCATACDGRFAAVTNVRETGRHDHPQSRGALVFSALTGSAAPADYMRDIPTTDSNYGPFNLLLADRRQLWFASNRGAQRRLQLAPGVYAISNGHWHADWPKTRRATAAMNKLVAADRVGVEALLALLADDGGVTAQPAAGDDAGPDDEQFLSSLFIRGDNYGTRASTVVLREYGGGLLFHERGFDRHAAVSHDMEEHWSIE